MCVPSKSPHTPNSKTAVSTCLPGLLLRGDFVFIKGKVLEKIYRERLNQFSFMQWGERRGSNLPHSVEIGREVSKIRAVLR